jgi:flagellar protein FlaF
MQNNVANIYATMQKDGLTGRALEAQVLVRAANLLKDCQKQWGKEGHEERLDTAVRFNQKIWTFFQVELSDPENPLPIDIRENVLSLSIYIDRRLIEILLNPTPEKLSIIINIDQNIAAGLIDRPKNGASSPAGHEPGRVTFSA